MALVTHAYILPDRTDASTSTLSSHDRIDTHTHRRVSARCFSGSVSPCLPTPRLPKRASWARKGGRIASIDLIEAAAAAAWSNTPKVSRKCVRAVALTEGWWATCMHRSVDRSILNRFGSSTPRIRPRVVMSKRATGASPPHATHIIGSPAIAMSSFGSRLTAFINSPTGPKTTHFWGPVANWGFVLAVRTTACACACACVLRRWVYSSTHAAGRSAESSNQPTRSIHRPPNQFAHQLTL